MARRRSTRYSLRRPTPRSRRHVDEPELRNDRARGDPGRAPRARPRPPAGALLGRAVTLLQPRPRRAARGQLRVGQEPRRRQRPLREPLAGRRLPVRLRPDRRPLRRALWRRPRAPTQGRRRRASGLRPDQTERAHAAPGLRLDALGADPLADPCAVRVAPASARRVVRVRQGEMETAYGGLMLRVTWEWIAIDAPALDVSNTIAVADGIEHDLLEPAGEYERWAAAAAGSPELEPDEAVAILRARSRVLELREHIRRVFGAAAAGKPLPRAAVTALNEV